MMAVLGSAWFRIAALLLLALPAPVFAAQKNQEKKEDSQATFKLPVGVVVVNAAVTDKSGASVSDLTKEDFRVYDDGKPRKIQTLALESYRPVQTAKTMPKRAGTDEIEEPGFTRPRLISLIIDDIASNTDDQYLQVTEAVKKFIANDMGPGDQIAIMSTSGTVQYPFSDDRQLLLEEAAAVRQKLRWGPSMTSDCPSLTDLQAQRIYHNPDTPDESLTVAATEAINCLNLPDMKTARAYARMAALRHYQEAQYISRTLLITLRQYVRSLRHFDATKCIMLFSDGFIHDDVSYEIQDVVEEALRAGVVLNTVNVRGLWGLPFTFDRGQDADTLRVKQSMVTSDISAQEDPLVQMARETGGIYYHDNNDLHAGMQEISSRQDFYYVLTYSTPPQKADGSYHSIKLEVTRPDLKVSYRKGYYAPKEEVTFERRKKEDIVEAMQAPGNLNEIPLDLSYNYYQSDETSYVVDLVMNVDIRRLRFLEEDSRHKNMISMIVAAFDESDHYIDGLDKSVDFRLTDENYSSLIRRGLTSKIEFKLPLGRYKIKAIVREAFQGKMGSVTKAIEIP
jgi:VWFA-related protein